MMIVPQIMSRIWDGDPNEYFSAKDMNRVEVNANLIAKYAGAPQETFTPVDRESQFRFDEAQKLENVIEAAGLKIGVPVSVESHWNYNRTVSFVDFERWEANTWEIYKKLGGVGDRIPSDKELHTVHATLFAGDWRGAGPYYIDLDTPIIFENTEAITYVSEDATILQRTEEYNAVLQAIHRGDRRVRVYAHSIKPRENIPIKITTKAFKMYKSFELKASSWKGTGPWTQSVDMGASVANAVIGSDERNSSDQVQAFMQAIIGVSAVSGNTVTIRAIGKKPEINLNATVMWSADSVA